MKLNLIVQLVSESYYHYHYHYHYHSLLYSLSLSLSVCIYMFTFSLSMIVVLPELSNPTTNIETGFFAIPREVKSRLKKPIVNTNDTKS